MKFLHFKHDLYRTLKAKFTILTILKSTLGEIQHIYVVGLSATTSLISDFFFFWCVCGWGWHTWQCLVPTPGSVRDNHLRWCSGCLGIVWATVSSVAVLFLQSLQTSFHLKKEIVFSSSPLPPHHLFTFCVCEFNFSGTSQKWNLTVLGLFPLASCPLRWPVL